jgi:hypothetical protein
MAGCRSRRARQVPVVKVNDTRYLDGRNAALVEIPGPRFSEILSKMAETRRTIISGRSAHATALAISPSAILSCPLMKLCTAPDTNQASSNE